MNLVRLMSIPEQVNRPDLEVPSCPQGLPKAVADKIQKDIEAALAEGDIKERYATFGYETFPVTRDQFNTFIASESTKYADVIKRAKVALD